MKRKVKKFNGEDGSRVYNKEDEGLFGGKINYREDSEGRKFVAGKPNPYDRNPAEQRYYSASDVKDKLSGLFGGKKEEAKAEEPTYKSRGDRFADTNVEERPRKAEDYIKKSESKAEGPTGTTYLREEADIDYKSPKKAAAPAPRKAASKKTALDEGFTKKDTRTTKDVGFTKKDTKTTKDEGFTEKTRPKSVVFKSDIFRDDEPETKKSAPVARKVVKETVAKVSDKAADTSTPKAFDMKTGNKTVYGTTTTDVFKQNEERKIKAAADKAAKKAKSDEENKEFRSRSLAPALRRGGTVKKMASGGMARSSASKRADGCAIRGKTRA